MKPKQFYNSVSTIAIYKNGKGMTKTQRVHIKNGKGYKEVTMTRPNARKTQKKKRLTKSELKCIQACKFKKGLFRDCLPDCA